MSSKDSRLVFVLDGITLQHAGELLFDVAVTTRDRRMGAGTYLRSLEDFAFSLAYGTSFSVSGDLPKVGHESPGTIVSNIYREWLIDADEEASKSPEEMFGDESFRSAIKETAKGLSESYYRYPAFWEHFISREARISLLGDHGSKQFKDQVWSLSIEKSDPSEYSFVKDPPYFIDRNLQDEFPLNGFLVPLAEHVEAFIGVDSLVRSATVEFVSRSTLAHLAVFWWYEFFASQIHRESYRVPHITRTLLHFTKGINRENFLRNRVIRATVRHALSEAIESCVSRDEVVDSLGSLPSLKQFRRIRGELKNLIEIDKSNLKSEKKIAYYNKVNDSIMRTATSYRGVLDAANFGVSVEGASLAAMGKLAGEVMDRLPLSRKALREVGTVEVSDYLKRVDQLFPELSVLESSP